VRTSALELVGDLLALPRGGRAGAELAADVDGARLLLVREKVAEACRVRRAAARAGQGGTQRLAGAPLSRESGARRASSPAPIADGRRLMSGRRLADATRVILSSIVEHAFLISRAHGKAVAGSRVAAARPPPRGVQAGESLQVRADRWRIGGASGFSVPTHRGTGFGGRASGHSSRSAARAPGSPAVDQGSVRTRPPGGGSVVVRRTRLLSYAASSSAVPLAIS
jgi:hypothetical protein